jgi:MarR family transcriptional regulator, negative regulator of the multidrug operon emrRAB
MHATSVPAANPDRTANLLGALSTDLARGIETATAAVVGQAGAATAALVVIAAAPGRTIEHLRRPLGLTQPGATRLVERLVQAGWVHRAPARQRRGLELTLTDQGHEILEEVLAARRAAIEEALSALTAAEQDQLSAILETLLAARIADRADLERVCRLCERKSCRACPVGAKLDLLLAEAAPLPGSRVPHHP